MFKSAKRLLALAAIAFLAAVSLYWWWGRLIVDTFAQCVGGDPPAGVDCAHNLQMYCATGFAAFAVVLIVAAAIRGVWSRHARVA